MESLFHAEFYDWFVERYRLELTDVTPELLTKAIHDYFEATGKKEG